MKKNRSKVTSTKRKKKWGQYLFMAFLFFVLFLFAFYRFDLAITYDDIETWESKFMCLINRYLYDLGGKPLVYSLYLSLSFIFLFIAIDKYNKGND